MGATPSARLKRSKNAELTIHKEVPLHPPDLPEGAVFKGYEPFVVQELKIDCQNTRYLRARYELPTGGSVLAPLPADVLAGSHFGSGLICYILDQYHHVVTVKPFRGMDRERGRAGGGWWEAMRGGKGLPGARRRARAA